MTELFDPPIDKDELPNPPLKNPVTYCLMVAAFGLAAATVAEEVVDPSFDWNSVALLSNASSRNQEESFCDNVAKNPNQMAELIGRTFCGHPPKPPAFEAK